MLESDADNPSVRAENVRAKVESYVGLRFARYQFLHKIGGLTRETMVVFLRQDMDAAIRIAGAEGPGNTDDLIVQEWPKMPFAGADGRMVSGSQEVSLTADEIDDARNGLTEYRELYIWNDEPAPTITGNVSYSLYFRLYR